MRTTANRWTARTALALAALLAATIVGDGAAYGKPPWTPASGKDVTGVATKKARAVAPVSFSAESRTIRGPREVVWPAGEATVELTTISANGNRIVPIAGRIAAGALPVKISAVLQEDGWARRLAHPRVGKAKVKVHDRATAARTGVHGLLLSVARADGQTRTDKLTVQVGYGGFAHAYGGDWATRLRLVQLPACALSTPNAAECQTVTPLDSSNNLKEQTLTADAPVSGQATLLAVQSEASGQNGDFTATPLTLAGTWGVSTQSGDFTYSYPLRMPPSLGGPAPGVSFGYSSGTLDGRTSTSNNQGGWIGDGWNGWSGFIERKYASCNDDNPSHKTGDLCWLSNNATLSLNGRGGELIETGTPNVWRLNSDDGTRIEKLTDTGRGNGDNDNEHWKVTTTDGTQYFFGYHKLPAWASGKPATDSTWTVPVYGNNSGEPCYNATFANAWCQQAWRWNLDYVIDPHDNTMTYYYGKESGWYGRNNTASQRTEYVRAGWLDRIEYGTRNGSEYSAAAPMKVVFTTAERCLAGSGCWTGMPWTSSAVESAWPDTPWDQHCAASPCTNKYSPTFWSARRLSKVTTQVRSDATTYRDVESWTLRHEFLSAGDNEGSPMWLRGITRTGHVTTTGGAEVSDPEIAFDPGAEPLPNRVDGPSDGLSSLTRFRIKTITTEAGGQINVTYSGPDCTRSSPPTPHTNTKRCMPVYWSPAGGVPTLDWFHRYVVTSVNLHDVQYTDGNGNPVTSNNDQTLSYDYLDTPAWHYTDDEITPDKYRTWGDWRGYGRVQIRQGSIGGQQTAVEYRYLRGMDGDKQPTGQRDVWVNDSWGGSIEDHEALTGFLLQQITFNGPGGTEVGSAIYQPWTNGPTATRTRNGITVNAWMADTATTRARTALLNKDGSSRGYRTTKATTAYNNDGFAITSDDFGDEAVIGDETCTRFTYARSDTIWMIDKVAQTETLSGTCAAASTPAVAATVLQRTRTFYDTYTGEASFGAPPSQGNPVRIEELDSWNGATPTYVAVATNTYDTYGRLTDVVDARNHKSSTAYNTDTAAGLVTSVTVTDRLGYQTTSTLEPAWAAKTKITDPNQTITDLTYDGLGRVTGVWKPGRNKASGHSPSIRYSYLLRNSGGPSAVTTESLTPQAKYRTSIDLYDGFLRPRQKQLQATGGGRAITETLYNSLGQIAWTSGAYYDSTNTAPEATLASPQGQIPSVTQRTYDGAGRLVAEIFLAKGAEKWRTTTMHGGDRTFVTPPTGGTATSTIVDTHGRTKALRQHKTFASLGSDDPATFTQTSYDYDLRGHLTTVTDQASNTWTYSYDLRGRQYESTDPDSGTTTRTFDALGNVETVTTPLGAGTATVAFTYDALGRKTSMRDNSITGTKRAEWVYDTLQYGQGKLTSSTRYVGGDAYTTRTNAFDQYGRPTSTSVVLPETETGLCAAASPNTCTYTTTITYRPDGSPSTMTMPAAADLASEKLTFGYTDVGNPGTIYSATQLYVYSITYNKLDQLIGRQLGAYGYRIAQTYTYDEPTRRLTNANVVPELKPEAANYNYSYDNAGNVVQITEAPQGQTADHQCFTHDYLRRMVEAWTPNDGNCTAVPTTAGLGGPAPYWHSWEIDAVGNRKKETRHAAAGDTTYTYTYPAAGAARPHTISSITASGPGTSWTRSYTYDNAGNTKTRPNMAGTTQNLTYNAEGRLETLVQGGATTGNVYDADGNRLIRTDPDGSKTLYMGHTEVRAVGTVKSATRNYSHAGTTIGVRTTSGLHWINTDHHGTTELTINASDLTVAKRRMLPYGQQRGTTSGTWAPGMNKGFVGGTVDPTELLQIGARQYDPFLGTFLSDDPVTDTFDPQQLHGYAYSNNSPATFTDPTGLRFEEESAKSYKQRINKAKDRWIRRQINYRHTAAVDAAAAQIGIQVAARGGNPFNVQTEFRIPGASKEKGSTNDGFADIVYIDGDTIYVWEVKSEGVGDAQAAREVRHYITKIEQNTRFDARPGFALDVPVAARVDSKSNEFVFVRNGGSPGSILYKTFRIRRSLAEQEFAEPVPQTVPAQQPAQVPAPRTESSYVGDPDCMAAIGMSCNPQQSWWPWGQGRPGAEPKGRTVPVRPPAFVCLPFRLVCI